MRIHPAHITEAEVLERQRLGLDVRDEEWEGVYHVTPPPSVDHQDVLAGFILFLRTLVESRGGGKVLPEIGVFRGSVPVPDYRIPDLVFVAAGREGIIARDGIRGGAPDVVIEILSPHDESRAKFPFSAAIGVPEVVVVGPDARTAEVWKLAGGRYERVPSGPDGATISERLQISMRTIAGAPPRLELLDRRDPKHRKSI